MSVSQIFKFGFGTRVRSLPDTLRLATPKKSLPGAGGGFLTSMMIETWGKLPTKCICHCELGLPGSYGCPMIEEAEVSSYNAMSACKSTFESSGVGVQFDAYDMV